MKSYNSMTSPILDFYRHKQLLSTLNASAPMRNVRAELEYALYY